MKIMLCSFFVSSHHVGSKDPTRAWNIKGLTQGRLRMRKTFKIDDLNYL